MADKHRQLSEASDAAAQLHKACKSGNLTRTLELLRLGAPVDGLNQYGETPLKIAAAKGHSNIIKALLDYSADINYCPTQRVNSYTEPPVCAAVRRGHYEAVSVLLESGAALEAPKPCLFQPLHQALRLGFLQIAGLLIQKGCDLDLIDGFGEVPLHTAVKSGSCEAVRMLLTAGANINAPDMSGATALHLAVEALGDSTLVHVLFELLKWHPNLNLKCQTSLQSPADLAKRLDKNEAFEILCSAGGDKPKPDQDSQQTSFEFIDEDGRSHRVSLSIASSISSAEDAEIAAKVATYKTPALLKNFGWQSSPAHWAIIERLSEPAGLARIAYFARNCCNRPPGKEFDDAMTVLGEQYSEAVTRFVEEGILRELGTLETIKTFIGLAPIKQLAREHGIQGGGSKHELCETLAKAVPCTELSKLINEPRYVRTPFGSGLVASKGTHLAEAERRIKKHMMDALSESNLFGAALLALDIRTLKQKPRAISPRAIHIARVVLSGELPDEVQIGKNDEQQLRVIGALNAFWPDWNRWADFGVAKAPIHAFAGRLSPYDFADEIAAWQEHKDH